MTARAACIGVLVVFGPTAVCTSAQEFKLGTATVKITPDKPVFMAGYASRKKPSEGVDADLFAKVFALEDAKGNRAVLITTDLIGFSRATAEPLCDRIAARTGLKRGQILINSSHTHTGPVLGLNPKAREGYTAEQAAATAEYTRGLIEKIAGAAERATAALEPVKLSFGQGVVHFVMNRREFTPAGVILGNNPRGPADRSVPVLRFDAPDGRLRAVLFGAGSHNTTLGPNHYRITGDYAGYAQEYVEKQHPGATAGFALGCAGDANPYPRGTLDHSRDHGAALGREVCRVLETKLVPVRGPLSVAFGTVELPLQQLSVEELKAFIARERGSPRDTAAAMLKALERGDVLPTHYTAPVTVWQFGADLTIVGLPGEVVVDYVFLLEAALGPNRLWPLGYCNDVFGYLPSARVLGEGGYETRGIYSTGPGLFSPKAQEALVAKVRELAEKAGRALPGR